MTLFAFQSLICADIFRTGMQFAQSMFGEVDLVTFPFAYVTNREAIAVGLFTLGVLCVFMPASVLKVF